MSIDATEAASGECAGRDGRLAKVAPLLAVGLTIRAISAETGIPVGAVHRAKRQIDWLQQRGFLPWADRGRGEAIIAAVNELIERQR
jgi:hypothetical protein